jgi:hypothetical protein
MASPLYNAQFEGEDLTKHLDTEAGDVYDRGVKHFSRLGWKRLTVVLIVEAIALGSLSILSTFASLGMVAGVICCVGIGLIAIYTSYIIGQVKLAYPKSQTTRTLGAQWAPSSDALVSDTN